MHNVPNTNDPDRSSLPPPPSYRTSTSASVPHSSLSPITRRTSLHPHHHARAPVEHVYSLFDSRNVPWATLKLLSNVGSPRFLPAYFEAQTIQGALELNLRRPETILGVSVTLSGTIMAANAPYPRVFWESTRVLWSADTGEPRSASSSTSQNQNIGIISAAAACSSKAKEKAHSKLVGFYSWSFSVQLPSACLVTLRSKQGPVMLPLPPSFSEKGASQFINYEITVRIRRGPLRIDSKLGTHFGFAPRTRPPAPSLLRQLAYQDNKPLVGPEGDPDGWTILPSIVVRGKLFGVRMVEAVCNFSLALPLTYSRGHPLPLMLTITCSDEQALDLVYAAHNVSVHLIREVCYYASDSNSSSKSWGGGLGIESSPEDRTLGVRASTPSGLDPTAYLPRAVPQSEMAMSASFASTSASGSCPVSAGADVGDDTGESVGAAASLAWSGGSSLYRHPSASVTASSMTSRSTMSTATLSALSALSLLSFGSRSEKKKKRLSMIREKEKEKETTPKVGPKLALHGARTPITSAVWWPRRSSGSVDSTMRTKGRTSMARMRSRQFEGEILLPKDLVPSFEFGGFSVKYALALLPFQAPGFELVPTSTSPALSGLPIFASPPHSPNLPPSPSSPSPTSSSPYSPGPSSPSTIASTLSSASASTSPSPTLKLTHEPLLLSLISIASLPYSLTPSPSASTLGSPSSPGSPILSATHMHPPPGISSTSTGASSQTTLTQTQTPTPRSRVPTEVDAHAQRAAHAERVRKPVVWGLFNQFVSGGPTTVSGTGSVD